MKNLPSFGLFLLAPLPIIESFNREAAFFLLCIGSILVFLPHLNRLVKIGLIEYLFLLFLIISAFSTLTSISIGKSIQEFVRYLVYFLLFISISNNAKLQIHAQKYLFTSAIASSIILALLSLFFLSPLPSALSILPPSSGMNLYYPTFGHNRLSNILIFSIPMAGVLLISATNKTRQIFLTVITSFLMVMLILSSGRGAMLVIAIALIGIYFLARKKFQHIDKNRVWFSTALALGISTIIILLVSFAFSNLLTTSSATEYKGLYKPIFFEQRFEYYLQAIEGFRRSPIFGSGLDTFRYISKQYQKLPNHWSWYTHNHFLQLFSETGFHGGVLFLALIIFLLRTTYKNVATTGNIQKWGIFTAVVASTIHSLIDFDWHFYSIFLYFWIATAVLMPKKRYATTWLNPRFLIILTILLLAIQVFFNTDSDKVMTKADSLIQENKISEALFNLNRAYSLDSSYDELVKKIGVLYQEEGNFDAAHRWYHKAILLHPLGSLEYMKKDFSLYLDHTNVLLEQKKYDQAQSNLAQTYRIYSTFHRVVGGYDLYKDALAADMNIQLFQQYVLLTKTKLEEYELKPDDARSITENIQSNEKI